VNGFNQLILSARISETSSLRYTPAGLPAADIVLEHEGQVSEAGGSRSVRFSIKAKAFGIMAERLIATELGASGRFQGFLTPARLGKGLIFEITHFDLNPVQPI
jgi:primosomal replication protein N